VNTPIPLWLFLKCLTIRRKYRGIESGLHYRREDLKIKP
jgi:hypothetical protein